MNTPRLKGEEWLEPGMPAYTEDLEAWKRHIRNRMGSGDPILLRARSLGISAGGGTTKSAGWHRFAT